MALGSNNRSPEPPSSVGSTGCFSLPSPLPSGMRRLKSSLKLSRSEAASVGTASSSSLKNVRFAAELTTVKKFDSHAEPISISSENSPTMHPLSMEGGDEERDGLWFNDLTLLPSLLKKRKRASPSRGAGSDLLLSRFQLDYDSDSGLEDDDEGDEEAVQGDVKSYSQVYDFSSCDSHHSFEILNWQFLQSNVGEFEPIDVNPFVKRGGEALLEKQLFEYLQGSNIRLHSLGQVENEFGKLSGLIYVNNLNFEKFIEIKFTFNGWKDIHYVAATYHKSITSRIDEFKFTIDLNVLKYSLQVKNLLYCNTSQRTTVCPLEVDFCCRYDVNDETFYDNNNYENYHMNLAVTTQSKVDMEEEARARAVSEAEASNKRSEVSTTRGNLFARDFLVSTTLSHSHGPLSSDNSKDARRFSDDTDYYNTSPLRHLYHNDTSLIRPAKRNDILINSDYQRIDGSTGREELNTHVPSIPDAPSLLASHPPSVTDSNSSYSSVSSPSEDFNLMDNAGYYHYTSSHSLSSLDLNGDLGLNAISATEIGVALGTLDSAGGDPFDDAQSIVTDTTGDTFNSGNLAPRNNSAETLITPAAVPRFVSPPSGDSCSSNALQEYIPTAKFGGNGRTISTPTIKPKDKDYQKFLSSYCFHTCSHNDVLEKSCNDAGSSPTIQANSFV
ncbi:PIG1 (YLR273C) and GAC1 (YOR178C) [Zygosaccharomyces parabailii]|nr:PIG1 (YLR273C) and GAC1 (YOR178C) [Zygosaccharomyces parabailii]